MWIAYIFPNGDRKSSREHVIVIMAPLLPVYFNMQQATAGVGSKSSETCVASGLIKDVTKLQSPAAWLVC